jgi:chromosome partition protein MukF
LKHLSVADSIAKTWSLDFTLQLDREDAAFLAGIHTWLAVNPDPTLDEDQLRNIYRIVSEVAHGDPSSTAQRATNAIARLREQRLMVRTDTSGIVKVGEYSLSRMGNAIAEWVGEQEGLTLRSLEIIMTQIRAGLSQIRSAAEAGGDPDHWESSVSGPLKLTVAELIEGIERRQQGMDMQQEEIRERIGAMLEESWFEAVASCETLLGTTSEALQELHRVLMHEIEGMSSLLNEIEELCEKDSQDISVQAIDHVRRHLERIGAWGENRFAAWSDYYQNVHEFIRSVISVDPDRAVRTRLRDAIKEYGRPIHWFLNVADQAPYIHLRTDFDSRPSLAIERKAQQIEAALEEAGITPMPLDRIEGEILARLRDQGRAELLDILGGLLPHETFHRIYTLAGDLAEWLIWRGDPLPLQDPSWYPLGKGIEIQNLTVRQRQS